MDNITHIGDDDMYKWPIPRSIRAYVSKFSDCDNFGEEALMPMAIHHTKTVLSGRLPDLKVFHYSDMVRDGRRTVEVLAAAAGIDANARVIDTVTNATAFGAMKAKAADYAPVAGTGFWKNDASFFDSASSNKWDRNLSEEELALYRERLEELIPDARARDWLERGG